VQPPEPIDPNFRIELPVFEGPLDLLLHLIRKHELDILDLPIAFVTERYLSYLDLMKELDLDVAGEYLVMAATLAHIKSKMLLPAPPEGQDDDAVDEIDPREELIRRLLEYQKYKQAAEQLGERGIEGRDVFKRGSDAPVAEGPAPLAEIGLFQLLDAFQAVLERVREDIAFEVSAERISIQERMTQIVERLRGRQACMFEDLFDDLATRYDVVVTFLAILEMAKMRMMRIYQLEPRAGIHIEYRVSEAEEGAGLDEAAPTSQETAPSEDN
jgi:segregation and condensation protein A